MLSTMLTYKVRVVSCSYAPFEPPILSDAAEEPLPKKYEDELRKQLQGADSGMEMMVETQSKSSQKGIAVCLIQVSLHQLVPPYYIPTFHSSNPGMCNCSSAEREQPVVQLLQDPVFIPQMCREILCWN